MCLKVKSVVFNSDILVQIYKERIKPGFSIMYCINRTA